MDNMYQPPSGGPQDSWPQQTGGQQENWRQPTGGPQDSRPTQEFGPGGDQPRRPGRRRSTRWGAGIALAALLAGGGALAATELASSAAPATAGSGQAAALNTILSSASSPASGGALSSAPGTTAGPAASSSTAASSSAASSADAAALTSTTPASAGWPAVAGRCRQAVIRLRATRHPRAALVVGRFCRNRLVRLRALGGLHGQFTFRTKSGPRTLAFARGVLESVTAGQAVVKCADGTTWTWDLVASTVVRDEGNVVGRSALTSGEQVFAGGPVVSGANDARLIVIRPGKASSSS
jgi:hypothetical protein